MKHLPSAGWQPSVLTAEDDTFSHRDESLLGEIPPDVRIERTAGFEPFNLYRRFLGKEEDVPLVASETISHTQASLRHKLSIWIRMNLFVPDARAGWMLSAVRGARRLISGRHIEAIVSIGPPHTAHVIGRRLSRKNNIPHVPVMIDPWTDISYYKDLHRSRPTVLLDTGLEKRVMEHAAEVVFVTKSLQEDFISKYPFLAEKSHVLYWGYNEESFRGIRQECDSSAEVILHAGNIFDYQNPEHFWKEVADERSRGRNLRLRFLGTVGPGVKSSIQTHGLEPYTDYAGFIPYDQVVRELFRASYLLMCPTERRHVPGKLFEYLRVGRPIIAFGDDNEEVALILREGNAGVLLPYHYGDRKAFEELRTVSPNIRFALQYNRQSIAQGLAKILDKIERQGEKEISLGFDIAGTANTGARRRRS
jgi:glycosyltransferase involved in cell wall biosynthesis